MKIEIVAERVFVRPVETTLRGFGVRKQDMEDAVAEVQCRTLEYVRGKALPETAEEWVALGTTIARNWQLDLKKRRKTDAKYCAGLCEAPDKEVGLEAPVDRRDMVDSGRMVGVLREMFDAGQMPARGDEILDCKQAGMTSKEIGEELGLSAAVVRQRLATMRKAFRSRLVRLGLKTIVPGAADEERATATIESDGEPAAPPRAVAVPPPRASGVFLVACEEEEEDVGAES